MSISAGSIIYLARHDFIKRISPKRIANCVRIHKNILYFHQMVLWAIPKIFCWCIDKCNLVPETPNKLGIILDWWKSFDSCLFDWSNWSILHAIWQYLEGFETWKLFFLCMKFILRLVKLWKPTRNNWQSISRVNISRICAKSQYKWLEALFWGDRFTEMHQKNMALLFKDNVIL